MNLNSTKNKNEDTKYKSDYPYFPASWHGQTSALDLFQCILFGIRPETNCEKKFWPPKQVIPG